MEETGAAQGMTRTGRVYTPEHLGGTSKEAASKPPLIETGPNDLWRKVQTREYCVVNHLNKTPVQISILSLLQNSEAHKNTLMKVLNEAYVPNNITSGKKANMVGVLIDGGSSLNICSLTTLKRLGKGLHEIRAGLGERGLHGTQKATIGEINLFLQKGQTWFDVEFQVLDISATYNMLLGRPWIHASGAVASTLHQAVKFEWNHHEVIIHGDGSNPIYTNQIVPVVENRRKLGGETYHRSECINVIEKDKWWSNKIESILLRTGYEPDKGLDKNLQGITKLIQLKRHGTTFGLGYEYTWHEYQNWSPPWRGPYYPLERPIQHLHQTFQQTDVIWGSEEDETLACLRNLFQDDEDMDCNAIVEEEEEEELMIQTVGKVAVLKNWTAAPIIITYPGEPTTVTCNGTTQHKDSDSEEEDIILEEIVREVENFENKPKSNLDKTEIVNLGDPETVKETRISIHLSPSEKEEYTRFLKEYEDIFAWFYDDMTGLSTSIVAHKLPTYPMCPPVKQKLIKFKPDMSLKIKEEVTKKIKTKVLRVVEYPTWLANIVPVLKKDGKVRVCVNYLDLNKASPKDDFLLPNIHILIDKCAKHELQSFVDCFAGYHQIWSRENSLYHSVGDVLL
ncbi:uncharacterized protein [Nicotiana sylvestris]|uniref:uncharacterized protein n=1 Tax=Nicotiana sylvestris TaxID=4096 RepID=UPI00388C580B